MIQNNARFGLNDRLEIHLDHVKMPAGNGIFKMKGRSLDVMIVVKISMVIFKTTINCLVYALIIAMASVNDAPKCQLYRHGICLIKPVKNLLQASGVRLANLAKNFGSFRGTLWTTKLLCLMFYTR